MNKITNSLTWKFFERAGIAIVQLALQIILARILSPEHYGVLSLMIIFTTLANVFIQTGFSTSLVQSKDVEEKDYSSVFWVSFSVATILYGLIFFLAPIIARFYKMYDIIWPLRILALMLFPGVLNSIQIAKANREMEYKKVFHGSVGAAILSGVIGIIIAYKGGGVWALVAQSVINVVVSSFILVIIGDLKIRFYCDLRRVKVLFAFGWKMLVSSLLDTTYQDVSSLVIGKKYAPDALGYYDKGKQFPQAIISVVNGTVQSVLLSAMAKEQDDRVKVKIMTRTSVTLSSYIVFPIMAGLAAIAPAFIELLLTEKWLSCIPYLQICCITFAFYPIHSANLQAINAIGRSDIFLKLELVKKAVAFSFLITAIIFFNSPLAIAISAAIGVPFGLLINAFPNKKFINYSFWEQMKDICPALILSLIMFGVVYAFNLLNLGIVVTLLFQILAGVLLYLGLSIVTKNKAFWMLIETIKNRKNNKKTAEKELK